MGDKRYKNVRTKTANAPYVPHRVARDNVSMWSAAFCQFRSTDAKTRVHSRVTDRVETIISGKEASCSPAPAKPQMLKFK